MQAFKSNLGTRKIECLPRTPRSIMRPYDFYAPGVKTANNSDPVVLSKSRKKINFSETFYILLHLFLLFLCREIYKTIILN